MTLKYTRDHEWIDVANPQSATVGITQHAQDALGDLVFVELPKVGTTFKRGEVAGVIESVKAAADLYMPVGGEITAVNESLRANPALANWLLLNLASADGGVRWKVDRSALAALHTRIVAEDLWPAVEGPRAYAVSCVRGASGYVSEADARRLEAAGCPVSTVEGAGHFLHAERPEAVADAVLASLA